MKERKKCKNNDQPSFSHKYDVTDAILQDKEKIESAISHESFV